MKTEQKNKVVAGRKTDEELGAIMREYWTCEALGRAYRIDGSDLREVGRQALLHGDIRLNGELN